MSELPRTLASTLRTVARRVPRALVSPGALDAACACSECVPATLSSWIYLECRLGPGNPQVDLVMDVTRAGRELLARGPGGAGSRRGRSLWARIYALYERWELPSSRLPAGLTSHWLEFDVEHEASRYATEVPAPGVFLSLRKMKPSPATVGEWSATVTEGLAPLLGGAVPSRLAGGLRRCFLGISAGGAAAYVGVMLSRNAPAVRLCVVPGVGDAIPHFLARVGWSGDAALVANIIHTMTVRERGAIHPGPELLHLELDADGSVLPRIGLEFLLDRKAQLRGRLKETAFLDALVQAELCEPAKREALTTWPGHSLDGFRHVDGPQLLIRRVNHVKLVLGQDQVPEAKAYLNFFFRPHHPVSL